jgi:hypothetical protein
MQKEPIEKAFNKMTNSPEFANLLGSVFGSLNDGLTNLDSNLQNDKINMMKIFMDQMNVNNQSDDVIINDDEESETDELVKNIDLDTISENTDSDNRSEILECEISESCLEGNIESINLKIIELNNSINNVFIDKNGNTIANIMSDISKKIDTFSNKY